jgi:hypothetical protein
MKIKAVRDHTVPTGLYSDYRLNTTENVQEIKGQNAGKKVKQSENQRVQSKQVAYAPAPIGAAPILL